MKSKNLLSLIQEYIDIFAWSYEDMHGLDPQVAMHRLDLGWPCIISTLNWTLNQSSNKNDSFTPTLWKRLKSKFTNLSNVASFLHWVANIVPVLKKNEKIRVCIDFCGLNTTCPKNEFSLPITDIIIDNTRSFERMSFMHGCSGYNQINNSDDEKHMSFWTPLGVCYYTMMPFGLKNIMQPTNVWWAQFSKIMYERWWNAMLTTLQLRVATKATTFTI